MGEHASFAFDEQGRAATTRALLEDLAALEKLLEAGRIESGMRRIGAEQELFLVGADLCPKPIALEVLRDVADPRLTTEIARFNLEANLTPRVLRENALSELERELQELVGRATEAARRHGGKVVLAGILPTLRQRDLTLDNMTPEPRYAALDGALAAERGGPFRVFIRGRDEIELEHDNVMLEACNTSFQVHLQVDPEHFGHAYNIGQAITGPVLAAAVNSPILFGRRLWEETRIALFQHSTDARTAAQHERNQRPRVDFGEAWAPDSVLDILREDVARFRVLLAADSVEDSRAIIAAGGVPELRALRRHIGTIWHWNRACYGVAGGVAHLRIENRVLPSGPTIRDEVANGALFWGLMLDLLEDIPDLERRMSFDDARYNFIAAARYGLGATLRWIDGRRVLASELLTDDLLARAHRGLSAAGIDASDIDLYLGVIGERVRTEQTGAAWTMRSLAALGEKSVEEQGRALVQSMLDQQAEGRPVHAWPLAAAKPLASHTREHHARVAQIMSTDLFTVRPDDIVDLAAAVMDWKHIRHVPVEDSAGCLVGIVSHRTLLRALVRGDEAKTRRVADLMRPNPVTVTRDTPTLEAMRLMRARGISALPVVDGNRLVGIVTERDLIAVAATLLEEHLRDG